ncbi:hypothetical protein [Pelagicoccus sp. SDUM812003]|uniref:hypothetical protein n=1 Tax=Pelagicoccus sp. SDUM812003 TaxID=3041267 RepID=UPI00280F5908|nr:hypothetical protein [Pelagicoccus sp. SDUM812003]MDQ8203204.1 hypothetical protein [Pelagicoccus sp. SDUM812003]
MPDSSSQEPNKDEAEKSVDLSSLSSFSFGTQWTEASKSSRTAGSGKPGRGGPRGGDRPDRRKGGAPARRDRRPARGPRGDAPAESDAAQVGRREGQGGGGGRRFQREQGHGRGKPVFQPYESQVFDVCFYPEDNCFSAIIKAMRANHTTYELFHVAKLFMEKPDRFIASITRKAEKGEKPEKVFIALADNMPFVTEEEAISHSVAHHADKYFNVEQIEVEPPSGNFTFVSRCPFTKELLGPPNYHKYQETLRNHHRTRLPNMDFEKLQTSVETVREEEVVNQWLESQKTATRYTAKEVEEGAAPQSFDSLEDAVGYLRTSLRAKVVKQVNYARVTGTVLEAFKDSEAFKAMEGERQRQLRFPLDTANAIRGRMRREKFSIYKKGSKGVTYVCSTKRNFRSPGQVMSPELDRLIAFLEKNQMIKAKELAPAYQEWMAAEHSEVAFDEKRLQRDLHWLIADGYVSHFEDDSLFVQPVLETGNASAKSSAKPSKNKEGASAAPASKPEAAAKPDERSTSDDSPAEPSPEAPEAAASADAPEAKPAEESPKVAAEISEEVAALAADAPPVEPAEPAAEQETASPAEPEAKQETASPSEPPATDETSTSPAEAAPEAAPGEAKPEEKAAEAPEASSSDDEPEEPKQPEKA